MVKKILIVEDKEKEIQRAKESVFGHDFIVATNFKDARNTIENQRLDGILTDLYFPDGYQIGCQENLENIRNVKEMFDKYLDRIMSVNIVEYTKYQSAILFYRLIRGIDDCDHKAKLREMFLNDRNGNELALDMFNQLIEDGQYRDFASYYNSLIDGNPDIFPLGYKICRIANERKIPCSVVTDVNHHSILAEPFRGSSNFVDTKNWRYGYSLIE